MIRDARLEETEEQDLKMADAAPKDFNHAVDEFLVFLRRGKITNQIEWIFPEDLQLVDGRFYVRVPIPGENLARARAKYRDGLKRGFGIALSVICWIGDCAYSNVYVPDDEREAELHLMPAGLPTRLKLSYPSRGCWDEEPPLRDERREAIPVKSKVKWWILTPQGAKNEEQKAWLFD